MSDLINRIGKFKLQMDLIRGDNNEDLLKLFAKTIIMRAEYKYTKDVIEYTALSPLFRVKEAAETIPEYRVECKSIYSDGGNVDIEIIAEEIKQCLNA
ncbi:MAG: hypothetical protein A4E52_00595 [Pelotomaculum sp. PtaB.Bin013]|uniref:Uncharacterized protein n=1 Tax=Pelotomaculum isophthalicicum JI TaxID=947010 RepID=A0A9X4JUV9_9FIRM|nr:hypothetical protein [Pelotomaculum isophthalicicum]MDF9409940.1 hypothetical protein [Pelotomaculum isophthalicicum JI]OPX91110.1 MAG: hypothetical protein A4E52_00595 [Pelotomaculum sp. PtaB.Bin013]